MDDSYESDMRWFALAMLALMVVGVVAKVLR